MSFVGVYYLRLHSPIFNFFFHPKGLYDDLASTKLEIGRTGSKYGMPFETRFPGNHSVDLILEKPNIDGKYFGNYELEIRITNKDKKVILLKRIIPTGPDYAFWGGQANSGCSLLRFKVPSDIPLRKPLLAEISVIRSDTNFEKNYGNVRLVIRKFSDE